MKNFLGLLLLFMAAGVTSSFAQNKTLGVGTVTPNTNAALHVESPTNNQGIIIPRLTTAQRSSFTGALTGTDTGLIVFDTDLRSLAIWNGSAWDFGSKVGEPITATTNAATGNAGTFTVANPGNNDVAINATTTGTGHAAYIENTNPANVNAALFVGTNGSGNAITANGTVQANAFVGDGSALTGISGFTLPSSNSVSTATPSLFIDNSNGSQPAASFSSNNSTDATLLTTSTGAFAFRAHQTGAAGSAGLFHANNPINNADALQSISDGTGNAVYAQNSGNGKAGLFYVTQATNPSPALDAQTLGQGVAISAVNGNTTLGNAAQFVINQATNTSPVVSIVTTGTGNAITANAPIQATSFIGDGSGLTNVIADSIRVNSVDGNAIVDFTIENKDISNSTLIAGSKISPSFGSQNIFTLGSVTAASFSGDGSALTGIDEFTIPYGSTQDVGAPLLNLNNTNGVFGTAIFQSAGVGAYAIEATSSGLGAINAQSIAGGAAGVFSSNGGTATLQTTNTAGPALNASNTSTGGPVAYFNISDPTNTSDALQISHAGSGNAIFANAPIQATSFIGNGSALTGISVPNVEVDGTNLNVFIGVNGTGQSVTTAGDNVGIGTAVLTALVSDAGNTAVGDYSLRNTTGGYNSALGYSALTLNTTGTGNVAMGLNSLFSSTAGDFNTAIGRASLASNTTGSQNTAIGDGADVTLGNLTNATAIGAGALVSASNSLVLGATGANAVNVGIGLTTPAATLHVESNDVYPATRLSQTNNGNALEIALGGLKMSVSNIGSDGPILQRAAVYRIYAGSIYDYTLPAASEGDVCWIYNNTGGPSITITGIAVPPTDGLMAQYIYINGGWVKMSDVDITPP